MKRKIVIPTICLIVLISIFAFFAICGAETSIRHSAVRAALSHLPVFIESYKIDKGAYPTSLEELITAESMLGSKDFLKSILHDKWNDRYELQLEANEFIIKANLPGGLFVKKEKLESRFKIGEALKPPGTN